MEETEFDLNATSIEGGFSGNEGFVGPSEGGGKEPSSACHCPATPWDGSCGVQSLGGPLSPLF